MESNPLGRITGCSDTCHLAERRRGILHALWRSLKALIMPALLTTTLSLPYRPDANLTSLDASSHAVLRLCIHRRVHHSHTRWHLSALQGDPIGALQVRPSEPNIR